jgi:RNA polymerase primary sigma factor
MTTLATPNRRGLAGLSMARGQSPDRLAPRRRPSSLNPTQQARLKELLDQEQDWMDHPSFTEPDTETALASAYAEIEEPDTSWMSGILSGPAFHDTPSRAKELAVLTKTQEETCFLWFNYCRFRLARALNECRESPARRKVRLEALAWDEKAHQARTCITKFNLGLAIAMLKRLPKHVDRTEMLSEGYMALLRAIDKFDIARGFKFSTYACNAIVKAYSRTGLKLEKRRKLAPYSFDPAMEKSNATELRDEEQREYCLERLNHVVQQNGANLDELEIQILRERYHLEGADGPKPLTLREVGQMVNLTKERVRQIQLHALEKIRRKMEEVI